jgi:hypothetical protein
MPLYNAPASSGGGGTDLDAAITINESGSDADFRVESSGNTNMLMVDAGNNRVGIGTGTPSTSLEIQDGLTTTGAVLTLSTKEPSVDTNDVLGQINFQAPLDTGLDSDLVGASIQALAVTAFSDTTNATALLFKTATSETATERMRITNTGRVGIGTTSPASTLEVQGGTGTLGAVLTLATQETTVATDDVIGRIDFQAPLHGSVGHTGRDVAASIHAVATNTFTASTNVTDLIFSTAIGGAPTEKLRIKGLDGKVGIGTSTPISSLEIQDGTGTAGAILTLSTKETAVAANDVLGRIDFQAPLDTGLDSDLVGASIIALATATFSDTVNATALLFNTGASETANEKMRITSDGKVGIGTTAPANKFQVNHSGSDANNGIMVVRVDAGVQDGDLLGGIGFDSTDGNVPSSVLESSAFIASIATEAHSSSDKGGNLKFGVSLIDENEDTVSTIVANVGQPDTITASAGATPTTHPGLNSRVTTVVLGNGTYSPTIADSGVLVIFENANSTLALPSINNNTSAGVQFTVFNETSSAISAKITVQNSATINGGAATALDDIESFKAATFVCSGNNTWIRIG